MFNRKPPLHKNLTTLV